MVSNIIQSKKDSTKLLVSGRRHLQSTGLESGLETGQIRQLQQHGQLQLQPLDPGSKMKHPPALQWEISGHIIHNDKIYIHIYIYIYIYIIYIYTVYVYVSIISFLNRLETAKTKRGLTTEPLHTSPGQRLQPVFILSQTCVKQPNQEVSLQ